MIKKKSIFCLYLAWLFHETRNSSIELRKLELICTGPIYDDDFDQAIDDFQQECTTAPFWLERNAAITDDEDRFNAVIRFNI